MDELESSKAVLLLRLALAGSALQGGHHPRQLGLLLLLAGCSALSSTCVTSDALLCYSAVSPASRRHMHTSSLSILLSCWA